MRYVALDFETLEHWRASVISIGCVVFEDGRITDEFYSLVCPPTKLEEYHCVMTHGLHYKDVKDSPTFPEVWKRIDEMIGDSPIIAHNVAFEKSCINACNEEFGTNNKYIYIDTLKLSRKYLNNLRNHKLDSICRHLGVRLKNHHNALDDARACGEVYTKIREKYLLND
jgi:DNA polymerase-3 subunit epsilon